MSQPVSSRLQEILAAIEALPQDDQAHLMELLRHQVQVIVSDRRAPTSGERYPLRGKPIRYTGPFESVAEDDWEALQ